MTITPDELIGAIKYDLAANGCNYPIEYKTHIESETFCISATIHFEENNNKTDGPTLDDWTPKHRHFSSNDFTIGQDMDIDFFANEVINISYDIQEFIKSENLTV